MRIVFVIIVLAGIGLLAGCVELDGQRISIRYVADKDELHILLLYDGIHDSGSKTDGKGAKQIPSFVANGDFMLFDWPLHFDRANAEKVEAETKKEGEKEKDRKPEALALLRALLDSVKTETLGHYRDPDGRIGAGQLLIISNASNLVAKANALLNAEILEGEDGDWPRTAARMQAGAREGKQWIRLNGHAIEMSFPAHLREWAEKKGRYFESLFESLSEAESKEHEEHRQRLTILQALSLTPISLIETPEQVTIRVGAPSTPSTFRIRMRDSKKTGLDEVVMKHVPSKLDNLVADILISGGIEEASAGLRALVEWGPAEDRARALFQRAERGATAALRKAAANRLAQFAKQWNQEQAFPRAPRPKKDGTPDFEAWRRWYDAMIRFPEKSGR